MESGVISLILKMGVVRVTPLALLTTSPLSVETAMSDWPS